MLEKIIGEKIELLPKQPKENEALCDVCGGIGWLHDKVNGFIEKCPNCYGGIMTLCPICHQPKKGMCMNEKCQDIRDEKAEQRRIDRAIGAKYEDVPDEHKEMMYSEGYGYNEGYFSDIDDIIDYCKDNDIDVPKHVWSTSKTKLTLDATSIVQMACEDLHEDAYENVAYMDELEDFMDAWCIKQSGTDTFWVDYKYAIWI